MATQPQDPLDFLVKNQDQGWDCSACSRRFVAGSSTAAMTHVYKHHVDADKPKELSLYHCNYCLFSSEKAAKVVFHQNKMHSPTLAFEQNIFCTHCYSAWPEKHNKNRHDNHHCPAQHDEIWGYREWNKLSFRFEWTGNPKARELFCVPRLDHEPYDPDFWSQNHLDPVRSEYEEVLWARGISDTSKETQRLKHELLKAGHWHVILVRANHIDELKRKLAEVDARKAHSEPSKEQSAQKHALKEELKQREDDQSLALGLNKQDLVPGRRDSTPESSDDDSRSLSKSAHVLSARRQIMYFPS